MSAGFGIRGVPTRGGRGGKCRHWDQPGLTGEWGGKPIHAGGQNLSAGATLQFSNEVLRGSLQFVEGFKTFTNYITPDGKINSWSLQARREIARDRHSIFYVSPPSLSSTIKDLPAKGCKGGDNP